MASFTADDGYDHVKRHQEPSAGDAENPANPRHADAPARAGMVVDLSGPKRRFSRRR